MSRKHTIIPVILVQNESMASGILTPSTNIQFEDGVAYQIDWTGSTGVGSVWVEGRLQPPNNANVSMNWVRLDDIITPLAINAASGSHLIDFNLSMISEVRLGITNVSGLTGNVTIVVASKSIGA